MATNITNNKSPLPTLRQLRRAHYISARDLADAAAIPLQTELLMETGGAVNSEDTIKVLYALSLMTGHHYTREQIGSLAFTAQELL